MVYIGNYNNKFRFLAVLMILAMTIFYPFNSYSDDNSNEKLKEQFDLAFEKMLDDPSDVDATMHYANLAIELEDYEAAIPPLERMLMFNPDLPRIKKELGVLYFRLDSYEMARTYLEDSKKGNNVPADVVEVANKYLNRLQ